MYIDQKRQVSILPNHRSLEKREIQEKSCSYGNHRKTASFFETLFGLLGEKRRLVLSYVALKLDRRRRQLFKADLGNCFDLTSECRCLQSYMLHLPARDLNALLAWIRRLLAERTGGVAFPGESDPDRRLAKFVRTFGFSKDKVEDCMLFLMLT